MNLNELNLHELKCAIAVLTGLKLGIHHLIAGGFLKVEQSPEFKAKTDSSISKIHRELDHYINALRSTLYDLENGIGEPPENPNI